MKDRWIAVPEDKVGQAHRLRDFLWEDSMCFVRDREVLARQIKTIIAQRAKELDELGIFPTQLFGSYENLHDVERGPVLVVLTYTNRRGGHLLVDNKGNLVVHKVISDPTIPPSRIETTERIYSSYDYALCADADYLEQAPFVLEAMRSCIGKSLPKSNQQVTPSV